MLPRCLWWLSWGSIFVYSLLNFDKLIDFDKKSYELPIVAYTVPDNVPIPYLGMADDDYLTGTQSFVTTLEKGETGNPFRLDPNASILKNFVGTLEKR